MLIHLLFLFFFFCFVFRRMGSVTQNALFAKTAPYKYAKHFNLNSVLDGLQGYRIASGQGIIEDSTTVFGELKAREKPKLSENKYFTRQGIVVVFVVCLCLFC
jgi:hypothetical protein